jgi:DNA polymerase I
MPQNNNQKTNKKIALIDGYGFVFRAFHALPPMTRADGTPIGAVYGFTNMLIKLLANLDVSHIAVVFDAGSKTFRNDLFPEYKANRPPCPEELIPQFSIIREAAEALNLLILEKVGFEADDLIATVAKQASREDFEVVIVSSDKDLMQLVDGQVTMYDALKNRMIGEKEVEEKFLVKPNQVLDVLSLMGDASDNVPGVRGIGPKTAAELINKYQTLENLFEHLDEIKQEKRRQMLIDGIDKAKLSKQLITLCESVPVSDNMDDYLVQNIDGAKLVRFLEIQGFRALTAKVRKDFNVEDVDSRESLVVSREGDLFFEKRTPNHSDLSFPRRRESSSLEVSNETLDSRLRGNDSGWSEIKQNIISNISELKTLVQSAIENGNLVIDFEFENKQPKAVILGSAADDKTLTEIFYIALISEKPANFDGDLFAPKVQEVDEKGLKLVEVMKELEVVLLDESVNKIGFMVKNIISFFQQNPSSRRKSGSTCDADSVSKMDPDFRRDDGDRRDGRFCWDDIALMAYVLNSRDNNTDLDVLVAENLNDETANDFSLNCQTIEKGKVPESFADLDKKIQFYCFKNYAIWKLYKILKQRIFSEKLNNVYYCFEKPLIKVLSTIENNGIAVDEMRLKELSIYFDGEIKKLTKEVHQLAGEEVNIGSPKQLAHILFEKLNLKTGKKSSKTGAFSTNSEVLEELDLEGHLIAGKILQWRQFYKLKSTYADALQNAINAKTKRIHTTLSNITTSTGRLSSNNPNLQNIPIRSEEGRKIRNAFVAAKGCKLISADYSQIELRVLADIAGIDALKQAFLEDKDIHTITAAQVFGMAESEVDKETRRKAKAINFGIIYGISAFGLAKQLKIGRGDAAKYIENYFATYPGIQKYMQQYQELARQNGFVETIIGRKCFIPTINSKNPTLRGLAERLAINAPIQGSAADIIKKAMIDFDAVLLEQNLQSKMVLQVHDELLIEAPENEAKKVAELLQKTMQQAILLDVPLKVDVKIMDRWE